jgi:hypothetical protein
VLGGRAIDRRTAVGQALEAWRADLVADLGGREALSTQRAQLVDLAVKSKLLIESVDAWLFKQASLVDAKRRCLLPALRERASLVTQLQSLLKDIGLDRVAKKAPSILDIVREHDERERAAKAQQATTPEPEPATPEGSAA